MKQNDLDHLKWVYERMQNVYKEDTMVDYMLKFRMILREQQTILNESNQPKIGVQIINKEPDMSVAKDTHCKNCGVTLRYTPNDTIDMDINHNYLGDFDRVKGINCPNCRKETVI